MAAACLATASSSSDGFNNGFVMPPAERSVSSPTAQLSQAYATPTVVVINFPSMRADFSNAHRWASIIVMLVSLQESLVSSSSVSSSSLFFTEGADDRKIFFLYPDSYFLSPFISVGKLRMMASSITFASSLPGPDGAMTLSYSSGFRPTDSKATTFAYLHVIPAFLASALSGSPTTTTATGAFHSALGTSEEPFSSSLRGLPVRPSKEAAAVLAKSRVAMASNGFSLKFVAHSIPDCLDLFLPLAPFLPPFFFLACRATIDPLQLAPSMLTHDDALLVWQGRKATEVEQQEMAATAVIYRILY